MPKALKWIPPVREPYTLFLMIRDPRTPFRAKLQALSIIALIFAYAFMPVDIIGDYIPLLGWIDDLILIPLGINLAERFLPQDVLIANRAIAKKRINKVILITAVGALVFISVWALFVAGTVLLINRLL